MQLLVHVLVLNAAPGTKWYTSYISDAAPASEIILFITNALNCVAVACSRGISCIVVRGQQNENGKEAWEETGGKSGRVLLFDDNKIKMARKPGKKLKENTVRCTGEDKR